MTLWSGKYREWVQPNAKNVLAEVRSLLFQGKYVEADILCKELMGPYTESYLPLGDIHIQFEHGQLAHSYQRILDLEEGIARTEYKVGNVLFTREMFASYPDQVIILHLKASKEKMLNFHVKLTSPLRYKTEIKQERLILKGIAPEEIAPHHVQVDQPLIYGDFEETDAIRFEGQLGANLRDGELLCDADGLHVYNASEITLYFGAATSFKRFENPHSYDSNEPSNILNLQMEKVKDQPFESLKMNHSIDYQQLFKRVQLDQYQCL
ncbi:glycoside hydrolase family 95 protein [Litchfieldia alkalitelluris]|uniref:glycoside hydrolase family 95 protein n=1 Tax=Litchfieldia alkalitelluris TaxID=304268 RepID=UPI001F3C8E52